VVVITLRIFTSLDIDLKYSASNAGRQLPLFIALHGMQTRSSDENSVCVHPSVCQARGL